MFQGPDEAKELDFVWLPIKNWYLTESILKPVPVETLTEELRNKSTYFKIQTATFLDDGENLHALICLFVRSEDVFPTICGLGQKGGSHELIIQVCVFIGLICIIHKRVLFCCCLWIAYLHLGVAKVASFRRGSCVSLC